MRVIDGDGHVIEDGDAIAKFMPNGYRGKIFPQLDHFHDAGKFNERREGGSGLASPPDAKGWTTFLEDAEIDWTVLYPTWGLAVGRIIDRDFALASCRAYNDWLHEAFTGQDKRLKGMALIPVQDPAAAVDELERAVTELGMCGAMLPSNGDGMKAHLGDKIYWPIYEKAQELGCPLAVHGGVHHHMGFDTYSTYYGAHALGHPFGIIIQCVGMLTHGVFDAFPKLKVGYLEGGASWVPFVLDRIDLSHRAHHQVNPDGTPVAGNPRPGEGASDYLLRFMHEGRIFVGYECDDESLGYAVQRAGRQPFMFASDFPHESTSAKYCRGEINEVLRREDLDNADKEALLAGNTVVFYGGDV